MRTRRPITGRTVLFGMLAFLGLVIAVNGVLVFFAVDSWSGLTTERPFEAGRDHDRELDRAAAQAALGWSSVVTLDPDSGGGQVVEVALTDAAGAPIPGLQVEVALSRPARDDLDRRMALRETAAGRYRAVVTLPLPGRWYAEIRARDADGPRYRMEHEIAAP